ncbi:MAG: DUF3800 domain-containing protein [Bacilli bacterium]|nr:DUF3800 domain-containing protein [Bacilli bacterium]
MIELYCDESRQDLFYNKNVITSTNKYIFIGGIMIKREDRAEIKNKIKELKIKYGLNTKTELKWNRVTRKYLNLYKEMIDIYINFNINFRTICIDSNKINLKYHNDNAELGFYKFYYQLLNNWISKDLKYTIYTDIKTYSDPNVLNDLKRCLNNKNHPNNIEKIYAIESHESVFLQLEDILMGATSYKMNFGKDGKSIVKLELIDYIENKLGHELMPTNRSATKFNLFEIRL